MLKRCLIALTLTALVALVGCSKPQPTEMAPSPVASETPQLNGELMVFVPCGIAGPYGEIKALFEKRYPGVKIAQQVANIDVQTKEIVNGKAAPDVWFSLGDQEMNRAIKAGRIDGQPVTYAYNSVAMMVGKNNPLKIEALNDLTKAGVKTIAVPTPENSSGYYAAQAFKKAGVADKLQAKLWLTPEPTQVKMQLTSGKAQAGIVYYPCTRETRVVAGKPQELPGKVQLLGKIPVELSGSIPAQAAVVKDAANAAIGQAFLKFLLEDQVQEIWENWGFDRAKQPAGGSHVSLYMYCGAGLRPMMDEAVAAFKKLTPTTHIDVGYAGSGCLLSQLTFSRRGDLYMPGEEFYLAQARQHNYIASEKGIAYFEPVILVQKGNPKGIKTLADLAQPGIKVGLGEPGACAAGRAADDLIKAAKLTAAIEKNVRVRAGNVPELGNDVKLKSLDAAIVWNVTAAQYPEDCDVVTLDKQLYKPSLAPIGVLKFSQHTREAQAFIDFLTSAEGQEIIKRNGMTPFAAEAAKPARP